jgi:hypothetical protein
MERLDEKQQRTLKFEKNQYLNLKNQKPIAVDVLF